MFDEGDEALVMGHRPGEHGSRAVNALLSTIVRTMTEMEQGLRPVAALDTIASPLAARRIRHPRPRRSIADLPPVDRDRRGRARVADRGDPADRHARDGATPRRRPGDHGAGRRAALGTNRPRACRGVDRGGASGLPERASQRSASSGLKAAKTGSGHRSALPGRRRV